MIPFVRNVLKNLFTGPATRNYPAAPSPTVEGGRFRLDMNIRDCVFCGLCARRCPADAIEVRRDEQAWTLDPYRCILCGGCTEVCPKKCLSMKPDYRKPRG